MIDKMREEYCGTTGSHCSDSVTGVIIPSSILHPLPMHTGLINMH